MRALLLLLGLQWCVLWSSTYAQLLRVYDFTHSQKRLVVNAHNRLRRLEGAADMQEMVWDEQLARLARGHAATCNAWHRSAHTRRTSRHRYAGENIWWSTERRLRASLDDAIVDFYNEKPYYTYGTGACRPGQQCGHYTAVVWSQTCSVGCAASYCNGIANGRGINHGHIIVCNYGPGGNMPGQLPFTRGRACSRCPGGGPCYDGLCASQCAGTSFFTIRRPIKKHKVHELTKPPPPPPPPPAKFEIAATGCKDAAADCGYWAKIGECSRNPTYMTLYCKKACRTCKGNAASGSVVSCVNGHALCGFWSKLGECKANPAYMLQECTGACNDEQCGGKAKKTIVDDCADTHGDCAYWSRIGECAINADYMHWKCRKACKLC